MRYEGVIVALTSTSPAEFITVSSNSNPLLLSNSTITLHFCTFPRSISV